MLGDINYNNEIDAYDLMFVTSKIAGLESTGRKAAGEITFTTDKKTVKAGEDVEVSIYGNNFKDINAFGLRFALDPDIYEFNGTNPVEASEQTKSMYNSSRTLRGDKGLYVALSNNGESKSLQGDMLLATFKMKAKIDTEVSLQPENVIVVSSGFDIRSAFGFEKQPADIKLLEDAVFAIKEINKKLYNEESVKVLTEALNEAQNVLNNTDISQENVNEAFVNLVSKLDKLERITQPNNEVLAELIEIVTSDGIQNNIETRELENFFINYVDPARNALQSGISAIGINEYIKTITEAFLQLHDKNGSIEYVNNVYLQYTNDLVSKLENKYTAESLTALNNAVTTKDINLIKNAVLNLEKVAVLDKDILAAVIEIAQGINETDYNSEDVKQLKDILTTAQKLFTDLDATQESIDQMVKKLSNHLIGLYDKDVMDLIKIRKQLSKLVDEITNLDLSIYTETSSKAIIAPLNEAKVLLENNESTFEDLDKAYLALLAAKNGLVEKVDSDKTKLNELIERADKIDLSFYTKESAESFVIVLKQAKLIMADETVTQKVVDEGVENLQNAIDSLIKLSDSQTSDESFKPGDSVDTSDNLDYRTAGLLMLLCGIIITATRRKKQDI